MTIQVETDQNDQQDQQDDVTEQDQQQAQDGQQNEQDGEGDEQEEVVITIGAEAPPANEDESTEAPPWVRELRKKNRELEKELRERKQADAAKQAAETAPTKLTKPTLESCEYDEAEYERRFTEYQQQQQAENEKQRKKQAEEQAEKDAWTARMEAHKTAAAALKQRDYDDVESEVSTVLSPQQQAVILNGADNSALVIYAIGKHPEKLKEIASIKDLVKFAFAVAKLETQMKATSRKAPPPAERKLNGSASTTGSASKELERLEAEADRTGDRSKLVAYKREQRRKAQT